MSAQMQLTTFWLGEDQFGLDVTQIEEVTGRVQVCPVPLSPSYVRGLINLRGQIATALGLHELFGIPRPESEQGYSVVCRLGGHLISLLVDGVGDVISVDPQRWERNPEFLPEHFQAHVSGVYKLDAKLVSVLNLEEISKMVGQTLKEGGRA